jgi:hypothetical protein
MRIAIRFGRTGAPATPDASECGNLAAAGFGLAPSCPFCLYRGSVAVFAWSKDEPLPKHAFARNLMGLGLEALGPGD